MKRHIGIDFGTTTSAVYYRDSHNGKVKQSDFISFSSNKFVPSLVLPKGSVTNSKGKTVEHPLVECGWAAAKNTSCHALLKRNFKMDLLSKDPACRKEAQELTQIFFQALFDAYTNGVESAKEDTLEETVTVVTYPAKFSKEAGNILKKAAEKAGFPNVRLCLEAEAAMQYALHFDSQQTGKFWASKEGAKLNIMLIDMGAGTTDIAVYSCSLSNPVQYQLLACWPKKNGYCFGGAEIDRALTEHYQAATGLDLAQALMPQNPKLGQVLLEDRMKIYKENLSNALAEKDYLEAEQQIAGLYYLLTGKELELDMDRTALEKLLKNYLPQLPNLVDGALKEAKLQGSQIDLVLLTGGHSQWYFVKEQLKKSQLQTPEANILTFPEPHLAVAKGAAFVPEAISVPSSIPAPVSTATPAPVSTATPAPAPATTPAPAPAPAPDTVPNPTAESPFPTNNFNRNRIPVKKNGKWGFKDKSGNLVVPCQWDNVCEFCSNRYFVCLNGKWGMINQDGDLLDSYQWDHVHPALFGRAIVQKNNKWTVINRFGIRIYPYVKDFHHAFLAATLQSIKIPRI